MGQFHFVYFIDCRYCFYDCRYVFIVLFLSQPFFCLDAYFDRLSSVQQRKRLVITDLAVSGGLGALHLITFIVLWWGYGTLPLTDVYNGAPPSAAIFFSLLSALAWVCCYRISARI